MIKICVKPFWKFFQKNATNHLNRFFPSVSLRFWYEPFSSWAWVASFLNAPLFQELKRLKSEAESETRLKKDLEDKVAKMSQLLTTGQEALNQEKKTVEMLRQQILSQTPVKVNSVEFWPRVILCFDLENTWIVLKTARFISLRARMIIIQEECSVRFTRIGLGNRDHATSSNRGRFI